jgi:ADP-heptose:LPS heptosyltransferase
VGIIRPWSLERARAAMAEDAKVLVVASTALGDSLLTTPLIETLSKHLGRDRVSILVKAPYADLYRDDPRLHRLFTVRGKYRWDNLARDLREDPHRIALLSNITEPDLVPFLWRCGVRAFLRYPTRWSRFPSWMANAEAMRRPGDPDYATSHAIENNLAMASSLGLEPATHRLALPQFRAKRSTASRIVLIHPGASRPNKRWDVANWAKVADALAQEFDLAIVLTGDASEQPLAAEVIDRMKSSATNAAGTLSLPALAREQSRATAFLSGDTGPYHLALAVGCPTVTLFAPTDRGSSIEACGPHEEDPDLHRAVQTANVGDSIATIPVERVLNDLRFVMERSLKRQGAA